jgi:endonuclease/exonuclease/phosphatase family metal-dependent hydrolase
VKVLTYNVLSLRMGSSRVAEVVRAIDPDVVCVQEAPRFWRWREHCARFALDAGLRIVTGGRPAGAVMLLARPSLPVVSRRSMRLPWHPPLHRRGVAIGVFRVDGADVVVASTHLSLDPHERRQQAGHVLALLRSYDVPAILGGDINEDPGHEAFDTIAAALPDAYATAPLGDGLTSTAKDPKRRIDALFVDRRLTVTGCGVPDVPGIEDASDHKPLLATIEVA